MTPHERVLTIPMAALVAATFADQMRGLWAGRFRHVAFAVLDTSSDQRTFEAFRSALG